jgi:hypothetical protein
MFTVSMFEGFNKVVQNVPLDEVIHSIKAGVYQKEVEVLRALEATGQKYEFESRKKSLPAFTPSGTFNGGRKPDLLLFYSQCIILDIDHLDSFMLQSLQQSVMDDPLTMACFVSPSGKGFKIIIQVDSSKETHKQAFEQVKDYFEKKYNLTVDKSGKDLTRLCFVSFDPAAWYNAHATVFHVNAGTTLSQHQLHNVNELFASCVHFTELKESYATGNRNNFVFQLACNLNRKGMSQVDALNLILEQYDYNTSEVTTTVKSAFNNLAEHGLNSQIKDPKSLPEHSTRKKVNSNKFHLAMEFIRQNFEIRRNTITMDYECRELDKSSFDSMNEFNIYVRMQMSGLNISLNNLVALLRSDLIPSYNPFQQYFNSLPAWDQETDHILSLASFVSTRERERFDLQFKKWMVRVVACALDDPFFNKQAFVLVHEKQNSGKSTFCRFLCPPALSDYIAENLSIDKDSRILLTRNLLINLDELSTMSKFEINALKSLFSKDKINDRLPYDRRNSIIPRRCSFIGSTNQTEFLNDESGSVRWLCFTIDNIDWSYKQKVNIDNVYAQAHSLYKSGFNYNLTSDEIGENEEYNHQYQIVSSERELINKYLSPATRDRNDKFMTATDILLYLSQQTESRVKLNIINIGKALKICGFERVKNSLTKIYGYYIFLLSF